MKLFQLLNPTNKYWRVLEQIFIFLEIILAVENINCVFPADTAKTNQNTPHSTKEIPLGCDKHCECDSFMSPPANNNEMDRWQCFQHGD